MTDENTKHQASNGVNGTILLVDDDKFLVDMYGLKFTASGFAVQVCLSAKEALQVLRDGLKPSVILIDITMPEMDGFGFLQKLAEEHLGEGALKIALTNQSDEAEKSKASEFGVSRYIVKASMIPSEVVSTVVEELAKHVTKD